MYRLVLQMVTLVSEEYLTTKFPVEFLCHNPEGHDLSI